MKKKAAKKKATYFREKRAFLKRLIEEPKSGEYGRQMSYVKKVFERYEGKEKFLDFLASVKPPFCFKKEKNVGFLITEKGREYLDKQYSLFAHDFKSSEKSVDFYEKVGEDVKIKPSINDLLN